jgi:hypothetical protein
MFSGPVHPVFPLEETAMSQDRFASYAKGLTSPGSCHWLITPNDSMPLDRKPRALYCAADGQVVIVDDEGRELVYTMAAGQVLDFRPYCIKATGTDATLYGWD